MPREERLKARIIELEAALQKSHDALDYICKRAFEGGCLVNAGYNKLCVKQRSMEFCNERCGVNNAIRIAREALKKSPDESTEEAEPMT